MNFKELVSKVSEETGLPPGQVRKTCLAILDSFADLIENQGNFVSPVLAIKGVMLPAKPESDLKPALPERKIAKMRLRRRVAKSQA